MRDIIGIGELGRKVINGDSVPMIAGPRQEHYVRQNRGEFINEFGGTREVTHYPSGMRPPETLRSLEWGTWVHPGDTEFSGNSTGFRGMERVGNVPAEGMKPAKPAVPAFGRVTVDLLGGLGNIPAEGAKPAKGAVPAFGFLQGVQDFFKKKSEYASISGLGFGALPAKEDTRGFKTSDFIEKVTGSIEAATGGAAAYGEMMAAHGKDEFKIGHKDYPTSYWVVKRSKSTKGGSGKTEWERRYDLKAGQFETFRNPEAGLVDTDVDLFVTLLRVGQSAEEIATLTDARSKATKAVELAESAVASAKAAGVDTTAMITALGKAREALGKDQFDSATTTANNAARNAIDAKTLADKLALEKKAMDIKNDPSLDASAKANLLKDIDEQKAGLNSSAASQKGELPFAVDWKLAVGVGAGVAAIAGIAVLLSKRK